MRKTFSGLILIVVALTACQPPSTPPPALPEEKAPAGEPVAPQPVDWDDRSLYKTGLSPSQQNAFEGLEEASVYHINWNIADDLTSMAGTEEVRYINREPVALDEIQLRLLPNVLGGKMDITTLLLDGQPIKGALELKDSLLRVPLARNLPPGDQVVLHMEYTLSVPLELETNYGVLASYDNVLTLAHAYPMIAVYDDEGWNAETPPEYGDPTYADASFFLVQVNAPARLVFAASGQEISRQEGGSRLIVTFAAGPARDFYLVASPDYEATSKEIDGITFNSYAPEKLEAGARAALDMAIEAFRIFGERYTPYPYTEFDIVATPTYALGIEYPGIIALNADLYDIEGEAYGMPSNLLLESVVAHESGHQWFYNLVGNDQLDEPWLDEALTQFITWQYFEDRYGPGGGAGFEQSLRTRWARVENQPIPIGMPVAGYDGAAYGAIIYGRGAFFFEALKEHIGEQAFDSFLKDYTETHRWGIATGESMKELAETHCNCDLTTLFNEWVYP